MPERREGRNRRSRDVTRVDARAVAPAVAQRSRQHQERDRKRLVPKIQANRGSQPNPNPAAAIATAMIPQRTTSKRRNTRRVFQRQVVGHDRAQLVGRDRRRLEGRDRMHRLRSTVTRIGLKKA